MMRIFFAVLAGAAAAFALVALLESLGNLLYPLPEGIDVGDPNQMREYVRTLPAGAFLVVLMAWVIATLAGGWLAARMGKSPRLALIVGLFVLAAAVANMVMLPHPVWFMVVAVLGIAAAAVAAGCLATRRTTPPPVGA